MTWEPLGKLKAEDWLSAALRKEAIALDKRVEILVSNRLAWETTAANVSGSNDPDQWLRGGETLVVRAQLLTEEITLRQALDEWREKRHGELRARTDGLYTAMGEEELRIRRSLLDIGYRPAPPYDLIAPGLALAGVVRSHPEVRAARERYDKAHMESGNPWRPRESEAIQRIETQLAAIRKKLTA
jgi:hypothetical protein